MKSFLGKRLLGAVAVAMTLATGAMSLAASNGDLPRCGFSTNGLMAEKPKL